MLPQTPIATRAEALSEMLHTHLGVGGKGFAKRLRRAGRRLPRWARHHGRVIVDAIELEKSPKLARQIDGPAVDRAFHELEHWLAQQDPWAGRKGMALNIAAGVVFVLLVTAVAVIWVLRLRGFV